jgi:hypothetical protein
MSMPVKSAPVPLGDPDHYAFIFPIRPCVGDAAADQSCGETRFQVTYRLPYKGTATIAPRVSMPTDTVAVMLPKSMTFKADGGAQYTAATEEMNAQAMLARNVLPNTPLSFTISGSGQLPRDTQAESGQQQQAAGAQGGGDVSPAEASARQRADTKPGVGLNNPLDSEGTLEPWAKYKWWILGGLGLALAAGAGIMMRGGSQESGTAVAPTAGASPAEVPPGAPAGIVQGGVLLTALKEELFALETDRLSGAISESEYAEQKTALEVVLRRAMRRGKTVSNA